MTHSMEISGHQLHAMETEQSAQIQYTLWRDDPIKHLSDKETLKQIGLMRGTKLIGLDDVWKRIRRDIIWLPQGQDVEISVVSLSGAGKSQILQGLDYLLNKDQYLNNELYRRGMTVVPVAMPFSHGIKAAQIPVEEGGPGIIPLVDEQGNPLGHGAFKPNHYSEGSAFIQKSDEELSLAQDPSVRIVKLREGSGLPFFKGRKVPVTLEGMQDRGISPIYNSALGSKNKSGKYLFIVVRNEFVGATTAETRARFDPDGDIGKVFNSGINYVASTNFGIIENVAGLPEELQRDFVRLLAMSTAPEKAIRRSNEEYARMVGDLHDRKVIRDTTDMGVARVLRRLLVSGGARPGLPAEQVFLVSNLYSRYLREDNNYNLDYFLRDNYWALRYRDRLIPASLCERYLPKIS